MSPRAQFPLVQLTFGGVSLNFGGVSHAYSSWSKLGGNRGLKPGNVVTISRDI